MVYADSSHIVHDIGTQREVASWFNRRPKTCVAAWAGNGTVASATYVEIVGSMTSQPLHCKFIAWSDDPLSWSLFGMVNDSAAAQTASLTADFDTSPAANGENVQWRQDNTTTSRYPLNLSGSFVPVDASLSENAEHYMTTLGKRDTSGTVTIYAGGGEEVRIPQ